MTSLKEWLRNDLRYGSSCPSIEELADEYIKRFQKHMEKHMDRVMEEGLDLKSYTRGLVVAIEFLKGEA